MKKIRTSLLAVTFAAAPMTLGAQTPAPQPGVEAAARPDRFVPIRALLRNQAELGLTGEQVSQLQGIQSRLEAENRPLMEQLAAAASSFRRGAPSAGGAPRELTPEQREEMRRRMEERAGQRTPEQRERRLERADRGLRGGSRGAFGVGRVPEELQPAVRQLRENSDRAMREAREALTAEQQAAAAELMRQRMADYRGPRPGQRFQRPAR
jgi:hypothetical protein